MTIRKSSTNLLNDKHVKGVVSELRAAQILLELGFLVFQNVAPNGVIDLIAISPDNETFRIDVKTRSRRKTKSKKRQVGHEIYRSPTKIVRKEKFAVHSPSFNIRQTIYTLNVC